MTANDRRVSVIIPVFNCERYLGEAIESVLAQSRRPDQVIVVDDGSTDGSAAVAQSFGSSIQYRFQSNQGTGAARNTGLKLAEGEFIAFLDADDLWVEHRLRRQLDAFEANPDLDIVSGYVEQFHSPELDEDFKRRISCPSQPIPGYVVVAMLIKRKVFDRVGPFETTWQVGAEMSWHLRLQEVGMRMSMLPDVVLRRRLHENNKGITQREFAGQRARILKAALDRRRRGPGGGGSDAAGG